MLEKTFDKLVMVGVLITLAIGAESVVRSLLQSALHAFTGAIR